MKKLWRRKKNDCFTCFTSGGEREIGLSDYASKGDSLSLAKIGEDVFTIIGIEDSDYTEGDSVTKGVKITTKEEFEHEGTKYNKLHTTRVAVVNKLNNEKLREDVKNGKTFAVKCKEVPSKKGGKPYFDLIDVETVQEKVA